MRLVVPCPAKVNLFLSVGPKDRRGYHPLRTIFQAVSLFDTLEIDTGVDATSFTSDDPTLPEDNTVTKAMRLTQELAALPPMRVHLRKAIPKESGLGGGSSDAAGFLRAAMRIARSRFTQYELDTIAQTIGADVPFFLVGGRATAEGYGERLTPLPDPPTQWLVIAKPQRGCHTGEAFSRLDEKTYEWRELPETTSAFPLYNDFERVAPCESLELIDRLLAHGAQSASLTGSGSAVFGLFESERTARDAAQRIQGEGAQAWPAHTLTRDQSLQISRL